MSRGVMYLLMGEQHAANMAVSLCSLRESGYDGDIHIFCDRIGGPLARKIVRSSDDESLRSIGVTSTKQLENIPGKLAKTLLGELSLFDATVYLDADTLIVAKDALDKLWPKQSELVLTQFSDWVTTRNRMRGRISEWARCEPARTAACLKFPDPVINTGAMGFSTISKPVLDEWRKVAWKRANHDNSASGRRRKYEPSDELALQLIFREYPNRVLDWRWNASCVFDAKNAGPDVRIWHFHGFKSFKRESGRNLFMPSYLKYLREDRCGLRSIPLPAKCVSSLLDNVAADVCEELQSLWKWR